MSISLPPDEDLLFLSTMRDRFHKCDLLRSTVDECKAYNLGRKSISRVSADLGMDKGETDTLVNDSGCPFSFFDLCLVLNTYWDGFKQWTGGQQQYAMVRVEQRLQEIAEFEKAKELQSQRSVLRPVCTYPLAESHV
jgi:hypothetical protein